MKLNNAAEMIADLKLRQSEVIKDNQSQSDSSSEQSDIDIIDNDINLDPITNDEITSVSIITDDQSKSDIIQYSSFPSLEPLVSEISVVSGKNTFGKFNIQGQDAIIQAKANENLVEFAATLPTPKERAKMLEEGVRCNNTDTWARYVYRTAFEIPNNKTLGSEFYIFKDKVNSVQKKSIQCVQQISKPLFEDITVKRNAEIEEKMEQFSQIIQTDYIDNDSYSKAVNILNWLQSNRIIDQDKYRICIRELNE